MMKRPSAADFMRAELEEYEKNRIQSLHIERANLFLAGKYELEEGEILVGLKYTNSNDIITFTSDNGDKWEGDLVYDKPEPITAYEFLRQQEDDYDVPDTNRTLSREYYHEQDDQLDDDQLPGSVEELYEYLDEQLKNQEATIVPDDDNNDTNLLASAYSFDENELHICPLEYTACSMCSYYVCSNHITKVDDKDICDNCM
jgi:hypothetical protein